MTAILTAIARRLPHPHSRTNDDMEAFARQAAANYEAMLGLDRSAEERSADFERFADKAPIRTRHAV